MADYADEFRDNYKNLRQSNDQKLKLNGATFRSIRNWSKIGNLITKTQVADASYDERLDELNERYDLAESNVVYSLNKKKRWEVGPKLVGHMKKFDEDDQDVRLYETRNRYQKKANCIAVHRSKGDKLAVKSTYANIDSIKRAQELKEQAELNPKPASPTVTAVKQNKMKKSKKANNIVVQEEEIVIDESLNRGHVNPYIQYDIEYSPKRDILKYGAKKVNSTGAISGSRSKKAQLKQSASEDDFYYDGDEQEEEYFSEESEEPSQYEEESDEEFQIPLEDLIYNYAKMLLEKQEKSQQANKPQVKDGEVLSAKDKKVFVNKSELLQFQSRDNPQEKTVAKQPKDAKPVPTDLLLDEWSVEPAHLKEAFGARYSEATNCWPRHFNISLSKQIVEAFLEKHGFKRDIDVLLWLTFKQNVGEDNLEKSLFTVSVCSNLVCKKVDLTPISTEKAWRVPDLCQEVIDLVLNLHMDSFRKVETTSTPVRSQLQNLQCEDLPNIAQKVLTKNVEELKLEMINQSPSRPVVPPSLERMNSKEVTKTEQDVLEAEKIQGRLDRIFAEKRFECAICYSEQDSLKDCVIIKSCGHGVCKSCVKSYVDYELNNAFLKAGKFCCPSCDNEIGLALLINLATSAQKVDVYMRQTIERIYAVLKSYKWCPSANCSNILQIDLTSNPHGTISCSCGFQMCLKCNNKPHFPARCSQIANYYRQLKSMDEFTFDDSAYHSRGKKCPCCHVFMEKNGGCNQMSCSMCKEPFCWNCVRPWKEHLKLTGGQHNCVANANSQNVTIKVVNAKKTADKASVHESSFVHRRMRKHEQRKVRADGVHRLLASIRPAQYEDMSAQASGKPADSNNTESIIEKGQAFAKWKRETRSFLDNLLVLVNELHFVCEHGHLSLKDASLAKDVRLQLSAVVKNLEIIIWGLEYNLVEGKGLKAIHQLRQLYQKGLNCIGTLKNIKLD